MSKVRYHLEQSVPELEDLRRKGLFDKNEINKIMRKRTDFEHRITGRGSKPRDFLKYAEYEENVEKLRKKRWTRLSKSGSIDTKPSVSDWAGPRRILFIYDRATKRYQSDMNIWAAYLRFARKSGSVKVIYKAFTRLLQLQPRNVDAWISAAKYEFEDNSNAKGARILLQRGLRFNAESLKLWLNYAKFELSYVSRLLARRQVLGLITEKQQNEQEQGEQGGKSDDVIELPEVTQEELGKQLNHLPEADMNMLGNPDTNPALRGDVALTIFDVAMVALVKLVPPSSTVVTKQSKTFQVAESFLKLFDQFTQLNRSHLCGHVIKHLMHEYPADNKSWMLEVTLPVRHTSIEEKEFTHNLQLCVNKFLGFRAKVGDAASKQQLTQSFVGFLQEFNTADASTQSILEAIVMRCKLL